MFKRVLIGGGLACAMFVGGVLHAGADPVNAKKGEVLPIECDGGLGSLTVAVNGNGDFTPGHVITSTQVGVPYAFRFEVSFTPTGGETQTEVEALAKRGPRNGRLAVCTFHQEEQSEEGVFVLDGTVWISYTPSR